MEETIVAIMYDFDKTLCGRDMQEYSFIPYVGKTPATFWGDTTKIAKDENMDKIIAYMYEMLLCLKEKNEHATRPLLQKMGANVELFTGVKEFFSRINEYGKERGLKIEHYIISSGLKEIIEGTPIASCFKEIFACEFHYNQDGYADFPKSVVNYTTKTQFLFRISKGLFDIYDDYTINNLVKDCDRRVQYQNMIYLGDGLTDVPCMRLVKGNGGYSIAIYQDKKKVEKLVSDNRVDFICPADYSLNSEVDTVIKMILDNICQNEIIRKYKERQL